jgi:hypothetical protein
MDKFIKKLLAFCTANMIDYTYQGNCYHVYIDYLDISKTFKNVERLEKRLIKMCKRSGRSCSCGGTIYRKDFKII